MNVIEPSTPTGSTIFCDEIRHEVTGKLFFIGVYSGMMLIPVPFPVTLKLALRITYSERPNESDEPVQIKVFSPGMDGDIEVLSASLGPEFRGVEMPTKSDDVTQFVTAMLIAELSPLVLVREGSIRVRAYRADSEIRLGSLIVKQIVPPTQTPPN